MNSSRSPVLLVLLVTTTAATVLAQAAHQEGAVTISLTYINGQKASGRLSIKSSENRVVYSGEAEGRVTIHLPFGIYHLEFESAWSPRVSRDMVVDKLDSFIELASTFVPEGGSQPAAISVKVDPAKSCTPDGALWAKLVGVYSTDTMERAISPGGYALFEPVEGSYVLIVIDGPRVRATLPVETTRQITTVTVGLPPCH